MKTTTDYKFDICLSEKRYDHKPDRDNEVPHLKFYQITTDVEGLVNAVSKGYCYAPIFELRTFDMYHKHAKDFRYSFLVSIDVDHVKADMNSMIDKLEFKPTFAYTSCSNGENGEFSYRLVYCFSEKIEGVDEYYSFVHTILESNGLRIEDIDPRCREAERYYNGNGCGNIELIITNIIYNKEDYKDYYKQYHREIKNESININHIPTQHTIMNYDDTFGNDGFKTDYFSMRMEDILSKYIDIYPNIEHTPLPIVDDDIPYILFPSGYTEIRRYWTSKDDGRAIKLKDGQGRRRKLFLNGIIRRLIYPNITFDHLLYNLLYELVHYISNYEADNIIGKTEIFNIARSVMKEDITKYEGLRGTDRKFMANPRYCAKYGVSKKKVTPVAAYALGNGSKIGELYDCSLTDKENLEIMKEHGLVISLPTLKRWREKMGITKYKKRTI